MRRIHLHKKIFTLGLCIALAASTMIACNKKESTTNEENSDIESNELTEEQENADSIYAKVQSIDGTTITAIKGNLNTQVAEGGTPPEKPADGQAPSGDSGSAPEMPADGQQAPSGNSGSAPGQPGGTTFVEGTDTITFTITDDTKITVEFLQGSQEGTIDDIAVNSVLDITLDENNQATAIIVKNLQSGNGFGGSSTVTNGTAATTIDSDSQVSDTTYTSTGDNENALRVDGATASLTGIKVEKTGGDSSNTEDGDFYGQNAGFLALNGANVTIDNATVNTTTVNGNGVFSYGEGTTVSISNSTIRTTNNNSGGIQTTGGATMNATNLDVQTEGNSAAAIRSDRGGGNVTVSKGSYITNGTGSPAIYSTANIAVSDATLIANNSEAVVVEGQNSVSLTNCDATGNMTGTYEDSEENIHCVMIYQSMSGDATMGDATFTMNGGSLTSKNGDLFYVTNTNCDITLSDVALTLANDNLLTIAGNNGSRGWGTEGANGGNVIFTAESQEMSGIITVDEISSLKLTMKNATSFQGCINPDGTAGTVDVTMDADSHWTLTADTYISSFDGDLTNVDTNGYHLYVNGELAA
ncbi:hypothetical protein [Anaerosporobacter faecicola]|uniref:hypothetical protein n=1 Tax=Anaerosporobacter faecicola TaxID=2718714 RepID=UPI00143B26D0|nr:hypothetical protein [Anaerosporobacter faecicola]